LTTAWPTLMAWTVVATLNMFAKEVQWAAGGLVLLCCLLTTLTPRDWWKSAILLFSAIPISSLYFYQLPHIHHEPLYKTAVALIPATFGSILGLLIRAAFPPTTHGRPA
jgi:hypothetical protein